MIPNAIHCEDLSKSYGGVRAVDHLRLEVTAGAIYGLVGPNGAGKTTAIKMMMNIVRPDAGHATVLGCDSRQIGPEQFTRIGYVSENQHMPDWMTVGYLMSYLKPFYPRWDDARADELLRQFDLPLDRKLKNLSRGMWMKASLASSLAYRPDLLVLDEPFSGLDPLVREDLIQGILDSADETTILCSSHDLAEIETLASHIGYMERGILRFSEEMDTLTARFRVVEVTVGTAALMPGNGRWPARWTRPEIAPSLVRFVDSMYDAERTDLDIRELFEGVTGVAAHPMPLKAIFLTMARSASPKGGR
jgi:ABC-2 type transport system ATP-binding protein